MKSGPESAAQAREAAPRIIVMMGVCGSGKTTVGRRLAAHLGWTFLEGDDLHPAANRAKMTAGQPLDDEDRRPWLDRIAEAIASHRRSRQPLVVACSALRRAYRDRFVHATPALCFVHLDGGRDLLEARMAARRDHFMPPALLASQLEALEPPAAEENALRLDAAASPDALVRRICDHLQLSQSKG